MDWDNFKVRVMGFVANVKNVRQGVARADRTFQDSEFLDNFIKFLPVPAQPVALEILSFTRDTQPTLLKTVAVSIMRNHSECINIAQITKKVSERISFEEALPSGKLESFILKEKFANSISRVATSKPDGAECMNHLN